MRLLLRNRSLTSAFVALFFSVGAAESAPCPANPELVHPGVDNTLSLTYSGNSLCEGYDILLDVPLDGGTFGFSLDVTGETFPLGLFQVFNDDGDLYDLFVDGVATAWKDIFFDRFIYQSADTNDFNSIGIYQIDLQVLSVTDFVADRSATVRLGGESVIPAIPAPESAFLLVSSFMIFAGMRRRKRARL